MRGRAAGALAYLVRERRSERIVLVACRLVRLLAQAQRRSVLGLHALDLLL
jgi:hypothetical protein